MPIKLRIMENKDPFTQITPTQELLQVAESRLPDSCHIFNIILMAIKSEDLRHRMKFYISEDEEMNLAWIIAMIEREDYGLEVSISIPASYPKEEATMTEILIKTRIINWNKPFILCAMDRSISEFFIKFGINVLGLPLKIRPCKLYMMDRNIAKHLEIRVTDPDIEIKSLNSELGIQFVTKHWHHAKEGSEHVMKRILSNLPSAGLFYRKELVSCVTTSVSGFYGFLHTLKSARGRGFGKLVELSIIKQLAEENFVPFCTVEFQNNTSILIHNKIHQDLKCSHYVDFIFHLPESYDD